MTFGIYARTLLAALGLLALATSASAECAWTLWGRGGSGSWRLVDVFHTQPKCRAAGLKEAELRYRKESRDSYVPGEVELRGSLVNIPMEFGDVSTISYECYPDTVDPRGPKGK